MRKGFTCIFMIIIMTSLPVCPPHFLLVKDIVTSVKKPMTIREIIFVPMHVNYAIILNAPLFPGCIVMPAIDILKVTSASIDINKLREMQNPFVPV